MRSAGQEKDQGVSPRLSEQMAGVLCWVGMRVMACAEKERRDGMSERESMKVFLEASSWP